ncbi:MAG: hypothetical protein QOH17_531, partial [Pseudonocardiales bacterium]|nr:hypothetical protein [Pseudonocardiales bacterium]
YCQPNHSLIYSSQTLISYSWSAKVDARTAATGLLVHHPLGLDLGGGAPISTFRIPRVAVGFRRRRLRIGFDGNWASDDLGDEATKSPTGDRPRCPLSVGSVFEVPGW